MAHYPGSPRAHQTDGRLYAFVERSVGLQLGRLIGFLHADAAVLLAAGVTVAGAAGFAAGRVTTITDITRSG